MTSARTLRLVRLAVVAAILGAAFVAQPAAAQSGLKIAWFDKQRIVDESKLGIASRERFEKQQQAAEAEVSEKQKAFETLQQSYNQKAQVLSEDKRVEMQRQVAKLRDEWQAAGSNADRDLQRAYQQALMDIVSKMDPVIAEFARQNGYDLMFDQTQVTFGSAAIEVTEALIKKLDAVYPGG